MPAGKLKNIIILVLALANFFLLVLVVPSRLALTKQKKQTEAQLSALLQNAGVELVPKSLPATAPGYCLELTLSDEAQQIAAEALLGAPTEAEIRNNETVFSGAQGWGTLGSDGITELSFSGLTDASDLLTDGTQRLTALNLPCTEPALDDDGDCVTAYAAVENLPIFTKPLTIEYKNQVPVRFEGLLPCAERTVRTDRTECIGAADALLAFFADRMETGWVGSRILSVTQGYTAKATRQTAALTPCWRIETDTGTFFVDGLTSAVTAA